jgi:transposase InsO family protein
MNRQRKYTGWPLFFHAPQKVHLEVESTDHQIKTVYIDPGSPWQNGYIESFHSRFRDEYLSREMLLNLHEARVVIEDWRLHYNTERPHRRLGYLSPEEFIKTKILTH